MFCLIWVKNLIVEAQKGLWADWTPHPNPPACGLTEKPNLIRETHFTKWHLLL